MCQRNKELPVGCKVRVDRYVLRWFGCVKRMDDGRLDKIYLILGKLEAG